MTVSIDVVIVNWNAGPRLGEAVASVAAARGEESIARVVVVDNASSDGSLEGLNGEGLDLHVIRNDANRGFGAACNQGARAGSAELILFLNPDARLLPGTLGKAAACLTTRRSLGTGIVGVRLEDDAGRTDRGCARFPNFWRLLNHSMGLWKIAPRAFPGLFMSDWDHGASRDVDHVMGAFWLMPRSLFESLGGFDESFFLYLEDLDFSLRASRAGARCYFLAEAAAYHRKGGASERVKDARLFYSLRSRLRYARKHLGLVPAAALLLVMMGPELFLRLVAGTLRGGLRDTLRAYALLARDLAGFA